MQPTVTVIAWSLCVCWSRALAVLKRLSRFTGWAKKVGLQTRDHYSVKSESIKELFSLENSWVNL